MTRPRPLVPRGDPADTVKVVGEFGVIARVGAQAGTARVAQVGPGDDAAVLCTPDRRGVATTDVLVEGGHFRGAWSSAEDIGHKAAAANLADVAAMGGVATALLVGLACPSSTQTSWLEGGAAGLGGGGRGGPPVWRRSARRWALRSWAGTWWPPPRTATRSSSR